MLRGVLAEAQDLVRNAVDHDEAPQDLVVWFSALVTDALHSPAIPELTGGATLVLTGSVGRGDALPNQLWGGAGDDTVIGRGGRDRADGAAGTDRCVAEVRARCES